MILTELNRKLNKTTTSISYKFTHNTISMSNLPEQVPEPIVEASSPRQEESPMQSPHRIEEDEVVADKVENDKGDQDEVVVPGR